MFPFGKFAHFVHCDLLLLCQLRLLGSSFLLNRGRSLANEYAIDALLELLEGLLGDLYVFGRILKVLYVA